MKKKRATTKTRPRVFPWFALTVFLMAELLIYSWCRVEYVQTGYELNETREEYHRLVALNQKLKVEQAQLKSPERIKDLARNQGLVMPNAAQIVVLP
jgi:cell division protein FtsL